SGHQGAFRPSIGRGISPKFRAGQLDQTVHDEAARRFMMLRNGWLIAALRMVTFGGCLGSVDTSDEDLRHRHASSSPVDMATSPDLAHAGDMAQSPDGGGGIVRGGQNGPALSCEAKSGHHCYYVDKALASSGTHDGTSWATAWTSLQAITGVSG